MHGSYGGFEYAAREARRELLEEARQWRLARLARRRGRSFRERAAWVGWLWARLRGALAPGVDDGEIPVGGTPGSIYLVRGDGMEADHAVEVYVGDGGQVVRRTDLLTGVSTDSIRVEGWIRR